MNLSSEPIFKEIREKIPLNRVEAFLNPGLCVCNIEVLRPSDGDYKVSVHRGEARGVRVEPAPQG